MFRFLSIELLISKILPSLLTTKKYSDLLKFSAIQTYSAVFCTSNGLYPPQHITIEPMETMCCKVLVGTKLLTVEIFMEALKTK